MVRIRAVKCGRLSCRVCGERGGHGAYAYTRYRAGNQTRDDYVGRVIIIRKGEDGMPKVEAIDCPTPGCGQKLEVKTTKRGKPTVFCKECRFQGFVRDHRTARIWLGDDVKPEAAPVKSPAEGEPAGEKKKGGKDIWDL